MKIAIDIDGTIYDTQRYIMIFAEIFDIDDLHKNSLVNPDAFWTNDKYSWNEEENQEFNNRIYEISRIANLVPGAKEVIERLQKRGVKTVIVTARGNVPGEDNEKMVEVIKEKLKNDKLEFDEYYWKQMNKVEICKKQKVDYIIDDSPIVCKETSEAGIKTIYLRNSGVREIEKNEKLIELHNWGEIYRYLVDELNNNSENNK